MTEIVNKFLLPGDVFMLEMQLGQPRFTYTCLCIIYEKQRKKHKIYDIFVKTNWVKVVFNMTQLMEILKILPEKHILKKYCITKYLILLRIQDMMDIKGDLLNDL